MREEYTRAGEYGDGRTTDGGDGGCGVVLVRRTWTTDEILSVCFLCENVYQEMVHIYFSLWRHLIQFARYTAFENREPNLRWLRGRIIKYESSIWRIITDFVRNWNTFNSVFGRCPGFYIRIYKRQSELDLDASFWLSFYGYRRDGVIWIFQRNGEIISTARPFS